MTDAQTSGPAPDSPRMSHRLDDSDEPWPQRPWVMAALCATAGLIFHACIDHGHGGDLAPWRMAIATFVAVSALVFTLGMEMRRVHWAAGFALLWGAVMALIVWNGAGYNIHGSPVEWPFWSGMLAVLVATPLFQTRRDVAADWRFWKLWDMPYDRLHSHAWTDAVLGAAGLAFTGVTFLLVLLIGEMFNVIGITLIRDLMGDEWFPWMLAGAAFGGAVGLLRERDKLVSTLQRLVMIVLAVLAPVLAVALLLFLLSLAGTGLQKLWDSGFSTAALMMAAAAFAVLLANAVIGNGQEDRSANPVMQGAAAVLVAAVLPLAVIAYYSMHLRVIQYGWTPERIWGVIAASIALAYGVAGLWAVVRGRRDFDDILRPLQQKLAIGLMLLAAFLALPIVDFGAISTRDQVARLQSGAVKADEVDWAALAFDFGPSGRAALKDLAKSADQARSNAAKAALAANDRYAIADNGRLAGIDPIAERLRVLPADRPLPPDVLTIVADSYVCRAGACVVIWLGDDKLAVLGQDEPGEYIQSAFVTRLSNGGAWQFGEHDEAAAQRTKPGDLSKARVEVETITQRRVVVDGVPETRSFE